MRPHDRRQLGFLGVITAGFVLGRRYSRRGQRRWATASRAVGAFFIASFLGLSGTGSAVGIIAFTLAVAAVSRGDRRARGRSLTPARAPLNRNGADLMITLIEVPQLDGKTAPGITVPEHVLTELGGRRVPVAVTLNGYRWSTTTGVMGGHVKIPVRAAVRAATDVTAGDTVKRERDGDCPHRSRVCAAPGPPGWGAGES